MGDNGSYIPLSTLGKLSQVRVQNDCISSSSSLKAEALVRLSVSPRSALITVRMRTSGATATSCIYMNVVTAHTHSATLLPQLDTYTQTTISTASAGHFSWG